MLAVGGRSAGLVGLDLHQRLFDHRLRRRAHAPGEGRWLVIGFLLLDALDLAGIGFDLD